MLTTISPWGVVLVFTVRAISIVVAERSGEGRPPSLVGPPRALHAHPRVNVPRRGETRAHEKRPRLEHHRLSPTRGGGQRCCLEVAGVLRVVRVAGKFCGEAHVRDATRWHQTAPRPSCANRHRPTNEIEERRSTPGVVGESSRHSYPAVAEVVVVVVLDEPSDVVGAMVVEVVELEEPSDVVVVDGGTVVTGNNWLDTHCP